MGYTISAASKHFLITVPVAHIKVSALVPQNREVLGYILIGSTIGICQEGHLEFKVLHSSTEA